MGNYIKLLSKFSVYKNAGKFMSKCVAGNRKLFQTAGLAVGAGILYKNYSDAECEEQKALCQELNRVRSQLKDLKPSSAHTQPLETHTDLRTEDEKRAFETVLKFLDNDDKSRLNNLLNKGVLLKKDSNNETSVLENLYAIAVSPRAEGLDAKDILKSTIKILDYPYNISQKFGDIPAEYGVNNYSQNSVTCAAASIEFDLADKYQAEFARFVNELTSPKLSVEKVGAYDVNMLKSMKVPYKILENGLVEVSLKPDKNALLRAQVQTKHQDGLERSAVDVLLQSTFMNLGKSQTYDSLFGCAGNDNRGLLSHEVDFVETIVKQKNTNSMFYQIVDNNNVVVGREFSTEQIKDQILSSLAQGKNVIAGITFFEEDREMPDASFAANSIAGGHEITIVGCRKFQDGRIFFLIQDSDDEVLEPVELPEDFLLPRLNHAFVTYDAAYNSLKEKEEMLVSKIKPRFMAKM